MSDNTENSHLIGESSLTRGVIIGALVVVVLILLCALYLWGSMLGDEPEAFTPPQNNEPETPRADADIQILRTWSGSDDLSAIDADLNSTDLDSLDKEMPLIERDLEQ